MAVNLKKCAACQRYLVSLGWQYFAHPPLKDHFDRTKNSEYQCSLMGKIVHID